MARADPALLLDSLAAELKALDSASEADLMRILDAQREQSVRQGQLYLTPREAKELHSALGRLLDAAEAPEYEHVPAPDTGHDMSVSLVTPGKLRDLSRYTPLEQRLLAEN